ncbi:MAG TPA: PSD1 and planctomycete cytochrome C domain-containing protein [Verrucomicrobiae bacterium]
MSTFSPSRRLNAWVLAALCAVSTLYQRDAQAATKSSDIDFNRDIRPILSDNCFHCHGPDEKTRKAKLRLDTKDGILKDLGGYQAVKPGDAKASEVWKRIITKDENDVMPPPETHKTLKSDQVALIKKWIEAGAPFAGHWSFEAAKLPAVPAVKDTKWPRNSIDNFIAAKLTEHKLKPSSEADRITLIRRVTFDLTGLPPTLKEIEAFVADKSPDAYEKVVDRLLASPRYGEHMARYWLDAARYGDTHGLHLDNERSMWPYRDWVVRAYNENLPFDQFTKWQIAGDLLKNPTRDQQIASGFNRCNVTTSEGGSINEEFIFRYAVDRTETTAAVWMGLTAGCAQCHDHKFDPISQKEFYQLYAFFNSAADPAMDGNILLTPPILKLTTPAQEKQLKQYDADIANVNTKIKDALAKLDYKDPAEQDPKPEKKTIETVWVDDDLPTGAKPQHTADNHPLKWITSGEGPVHSGQKAIKRSGKGIVQDFFDGLPQQLFVPAKGKIFTHVYLDPKDPPKGVMLQFNTGSWSHRALWGETNSIEWGKEGTVERIVMGPLPKTGEWVKLEFDIAKLKLKAGTKFAGLAFTHKDGTMYWDKTGVSYTVDPANDPTYSLSLWLKTNQGKVVAGVPDDVKNILRSIKPEERKPEQHQRLRDYYFENVCQGTSDIFDPLRAEKKPFQDKRDELDKSIDATFIMADLPQKRDAFVMIRGQYNQPGDKVKPGTPAAFPKIKSRSEIPDRLDLADWLVSEENPLTARVTVNRYWQQFFGTGLVKTSGDFGSQGQPPSHPELLDWLAVTFRKQGWDTKKFVRLIVTSATYRQDSKVNAKLIAADPENLLLARGPRFRFDAEVLRDNVLAVSGLMNNTIGGKAVKPYQPENIWEPVAYSGSNTRYYKQDAGDALYRRSLYTFIKRTAPAPAMTTFDAPSREAFCVKRERSNTPLQALQLMNDVQHFEAARAFAQRMMKEGGTTVSDRLAFGFQTATGREPSKQETEVLKDSYFKQLVRYEKDTEAAKKAISYGDSKADTTLNVSELAAYTIVANMVLNMDEVVTKN